MTDSPVRRRPKWSTVLIARLARPRPLDNIAAEAFIRGFEAGQEWDGPCGDGDDMYTEFKRWWHR